MQTLYHAHADLHPSESKFSTRADKFTTARQCLTAHASLDIFKTHWLSSSTLPSTSPGLSTVIRWNLHCQLKAAKTTCPFCTILCLFKLFFFSLNTDKLLHEQFEKQLVALAKSTVSALEFRSTFQISHKKMRFVNIVGAGVSAKGQIRYTWPPSSFPLGCTS